AKFSLGFLRLERNINYYWITNQNNYGILATVTGMSDLLNPPSPNYTLAKSVAIMTNFLTSVEDVASEKIPYDFELFQNYPNPFNASTIVTYQLSQPAEVTVKAFNLAGQEVALLVQAMQQPGYYRIEWNAGNLPSGVYFYQIEADKQLLKKKCLLLK
ncbi:MAG TPA: T9SS type A sorting domain-containing protein, partial [bacterium]